MPSLLADTITVTCERCGREFSFELWSVVDTEERPDLAARVRDGSIRVFACPNCGETVSSIDPLLIYRPSEGGIGAMILACSDAGDAAVIQKEGGPLARWVAAKLGAADDEIGVIPVPWEKLLAVMGRNIQADLETPDASLDLPPALGASYREILGRMRRDRGLEWVTNLGDADLPPINYFEHIDVSSCPHCGKPFKAQLCFIATERPGLAAEVRSGNLQSQICPHCSQRVEMGGMLFVWRPRRSPRILVSPAPGMSAEMARQASVTLFEVLQRYLGAKFREEWISQAQVLSREELAATLSAAPSS